MLFRSKSDDHFLQGDVGKYLKARWEKLGGFSAEISKAIGWPT